MQQQKQTFTLWQIIILFFSFYVLVSLMIGTFFTLSPQKEQILRWLDNIVCSIFIFDFFYQLFTNQKKWRYLITWGWIDLISSIPNIAILRIGRIVRMLRILRLLRGIRSVRVLFNLIFQNKAKGTLASVVMMAFILVTFSSMAILNVETDPTSNIKTAGDALWWALVTITTIGYGDRYPVTTEGRIIAAGLMVVGSTLFATFTAYIASTFIQSGSKKENSKS